MNHNEKMWVFYVTLSENSWGVKNQKFSFEEEAWDLALKAAAKNGFNTIKLDVGDGVRYNSHPELAVADSKSRKWVKEQIKKAEALGLRILPRVNFSAFHCSWLGEYSRMISTKPYYNVCRDVILEVCEIFEGPEYLSLCMDEEDGDHLFRRDMYIIREGELLWHDLRFLFDCTREAGSKPWICSDILFTHPEEFPKEMGTEDMLISPWYYNALRKEHYTRVDARQITIDYYNQPKYKWMNMTYVEEDPFLVRFREQALPNAKKGYMYLPGLSPCNHCAWCEQDVMEYFSKNAPESIVGFYEAPWQWMTMENIEAQYEAMRRYAKAREMFFPQG